MVLAKTFLAAALAGAALGTAPAADAPRLPQLQGVVAELVRNGAPGALAVVRTPHSIERAAAGAARLHPRVRLRSTDRFRIASVTKTFVATVVLELVGEGRLRLDDAVERWLPHVVPDGGSITLRELLGHTSGIADFDDDASWAAARVADPSRVWTPRELVRIAVARPRLFAPGTRWSYSNTNYVLLGLVVEAATGRPLALELRDRLFGPLGLHATSYPARTALTGTFAHGYVVGRPPLPIPAGRLFDVSSVLSPSAWGAGQIVSNADDVTRFFSALVRGRIVPRALLATMESEGLGVRVETTRCGRAVGHDGDVPGYRNVVLATADGRRSASVMVNVDETRVPWSVLRAAAVDVLCGA